MRIRLPAQEWTGSAITVTLTAQDWSFYTPEQPILAIPIERLMIKMASDNNKDTSRKGKRGAKPQTVTIKEQWEDAVKIALEKKKPKEGWPKH